MLSKKHFLMHGRHIPLLFVLEVAFILIFAFCTEYDDYAHSGHGFNKTHLNEQNDIQHYYSSKFDFLLIFVHNHRWWI